MNGQGRRYFRLETLPKARTIRDSQTITVTESEVTMALGLTV